MTQRSSAYTGRTVTFATMHGRELLARDAFHHILGATVTAPRALDTDQSGNSKQDSYKRTAQRPGEPSAYRRSNPSKSALERPLARTENLSAHRPHCGQPTGSKTRPRLEVCDRVKVYFTIARFTGRSFVAQDYREPHLNEWLFVHHGPWPRARISLGTEPPISLQ